MKFTTHLALQSQGTRLVKNAPYVKVCKEKDGILTLSDAIFQETYPYAFTGNTFIDYNSEP